MGVGAAVRVFATEASGRPDATAKRQLLGYQEITLNGGYSSSRPAVVHFGLGKATRCDVKVTLPSREQPIFLRDVKVNQKLRVREP
jgi:hypothetical protein